MSPKDEQPTKHDTVADPSSRTLDAVTLETITLGATLLATPYGAVDPEPPPPDDGAFATRYELGEVLGEGGMGEVRLCKDRRIGREVAVKVIRPGHGSRSDLRLRFVREARVQGQLEHPAIVPVYDLGLRPEPAYFTMKRVRGVTFEEIIEGQKKSADAKSTYSRRKLLTAFGSVCLAVDFAHARGVVHRDLKPGNVMLGHFGEVYVLDWGVAKIGHANEATEPVVVGDDDRNARTAVGALMGTIGYMAPEQLRGAAVDARSDVYALGAILFELLTCEPLHVGTRASEVAAATLTGADARASSRAPAREVPPELEAICVKATRLDPADRFASARELSEAVERYLDGDRDLEQRRAMAEAHARSAEEAAASGDSPEARSLALREVGRALALDPTNEEALATMVRLLVEPPRVPPPEAAARLQAARKRLYEAAGRAGAIVFVSWLLYLPLLFWTGVRDASLLLTAMVLAMIAAALALRIWRTANARLFLPLAVVNAVAVMCLTRMFGPFIVVPAMATAIGTGFALDQDRRRYPLVLVISALVVPVPLLLEWTGVISPSYIFKDGMMCVVPHMLELSPVPTQTVLLLVTLGVIFSASMYVAWLARLLADAERSRELHAWQLAQLVPRKARSSAAPPPPPKC